MTAIERVKALSPDEFALLGLAQLAYVKAGIMDGQPGFGIHAADGRMIGFAPNRSLALRLIRENDLEPASVN
jgi:hypothetical protein